MSIKADALVRAVIDVLIGLGVIKEEDLPDDKEKDQSPVD